MPSVAVSADTLKKQISDLGVAADEIGRTRQAITAQYQQLGYQWNDAKYKNLGNIVRESNASLRNIEKIFLQGLETLSLRVERHVQNALKVVEYLENNPKVAKVNHPAVPSHPDHELYKKLFPNGGGSIFTFDIKGGEKEAWEFIDHLRIFSLLANVADVKSRRLNVSKP